MHSAPAVSLLTSELAHKNFWFHQWWKIIYFSCVLWTGECFIHSALNMRHNLDVRKPHYLYPSKPQLRCRVQAQQVDSSATQFLPVRNGSSWNYFCTNISILISFCFEITPPLTPFNKVKALSGASLGGTAGVSFSNSSCSLIVSQNQSQNEIFYGHYSADCFYWPKHALFFFPGEVLRGIAHIWSTRKVWDFLWSSLVLPGALPQQPPLEAVTEDVQVVTVTPAGPGRARGPGTQSGQTLWELLL